MEILRATVRVFVQSGPAAIICAASIGLVPWLADDTPSIPVLALIASLSIALGFMISNTLRYELRSLEARIPSLLVPRVTAEKFDIIRKRLAQELTVLLKYRPDLFPDDIDSIALFLDIGTTDSRRRAQQSDTRIYAHVLGQYNGFVDARILHEKIDVTDLMQSMAGARTWNPLLLETRIQDSFVFDHLGDGFVPWEVFRRNEKTPNVALISSIDMSRMSWHQTIETIGTVRMVNSHLLEIFSKS